MLRFQYNQVFLKSLEFFDNYQIILVVADRQEPDSILNICNTKPYINLLELILLGYEKSCRSI